MNLPPDFLRPSNEFSLMPFWFWNDALDEDELIRQIDDFQAHGVDGFLIHPRVGLPRDLGWMSDELLHFYHVAIGEARRRNMRVLLYDEGMYPSGSSSGQVVTEDPAYACRCLAKIDLADGAEPRLADDENLVAVVERAGGSRLAVVDRKVDAFIRGIHYIGDGPAEDEPPATDLLNPDAVATFVRLVYDKFAAHFQDDFGATILAIFTDEPDLLGKCRERDVMPGTTGILEHVSRILGYDFTPHLAALWHDDEPDALRVRNDYRHALDVRMEETYYCQLADWCSAHGLPLTGHPRSGDDIGPLRHFDFPGQDLVWRWVLPDDPTALEGPESTQGKCSASAMLHGGRRRNANEFCGAYGHGLTWDEMTWLANWCFVRGVNLLIPHAFYYSVRGVRRNERPPDVGPNSPWWHRYREHAAACRRLSWLNTDSRHVCDIAILGKANWLPWRAAKVCFQHQRDFNYLEERDLLDRAEIDEEGIRIAGMTYRALILEHEPDAPVSDVLAPMARAGRIIRCTKDADDEILLNLLNHLVPADVMLDRPLPGLRVRHVRKSGLHWYLLFNEEKQTLTAQIIFSAVGSQWQVNLITGEHQAGLKDQKIELLGHELAVVALFPSKAVR